MDIDIAVVASEIEAAYNACLPGRQVVERNAGLRALWRWISTRDARDARPSLRLGRVLINRRQFSNR
jgi:hypothetical protein